MVHYRDSSADAQRLKQELEQGHPDSVALLQADLLDTGGIPALVDQAARQFGRLDALVNNASSFFRRLLVTVPNKPGMIWWAAI